ncbi:MAG: hypothetical protein ABL958_06400, partial [Bdellovibrionia bacterium]
MVRGRIQVIALLLLGLCCIGYFQNCAPSGGGSLILNSNGTRSGNGGGGGTNPSASGDFTLVTQNNVANNGTIICPTDSTMIGCANSCAGYAGGGAFQVQGTEQCRGRCADTNLT